MSTEIELKLAVAPAAAAALLRHPAVKALRRARMRTEHFASTYYDTTDFRLAQDGVALRIRRAGGHWVQTIKGPPGPDAGAGLHARDEHEWAVPRPSLDLARLATTPWRKLVAKAARRGGLVRCYTTAFERKRIPLRFPDGTLAELCVDRGEIRAVRDGRTRRASISEIEIELELESGDSANLFRLALRLAADLPVAVMTESKAQRGRALARGGRAVAPGPVKARGVALSAKATTAEALALLARECLDQIAANAPGLRADDDPEWVHQMRIGTRRLRSCLALIASCAPSAALAELVADVRWLAEALGSARDWDVFVEETLPPLAAWFAQDIKTAAGLRRLRARAQHRRRNARAAAREAVGSPRFQRLLLAGGLLCALPRLGSDRSAGSGENPDVLAGSAIAFAAELLGRRQRKLARRARSLVLGSPEERHAVRIAAKRLRYVAEFFASPYSRKRSRAYLKALTGLQDVLGRLNDAATALAIASATDGNAEDAATGAVRGWVAAQAAALEPDLASAWRRFARVKPFWV